MVTANPVPKVGNTFVAVQNIVGLELISGPSFSSPGENLEFLTYYFHLGENTVSKGEHVLLLDIMLESDIVPSIKRNNGLFKFLDIKGNRVFYMRITPVLHNDLDWRDRANHIFYMYFMSPEKYYASHK
jgi:hypothetical protein